MGNNKAVRFATQKTVKLIGSCSDMSTTEKRNVWYNREEMNKFREDAKHCAKCLKKSRVQRAVETSFLTSFRESLVAPQSTNAATKHSCSSTAADSITRAFESSTLGYTIDQREKKRGLEHIVDMERLQIRCISRLVVLKAQERLKATNRVNDDDDAAIQLSMIASKFSRWAKEIAQLTGKMDAFDAYTTDFNIVVTTQETTNLQYYGKEETCVAQPQKKARIRLEGPGFTTMKPIIGEEILRRKNAINIGQQQAVLVSGST